MSLAATYIQEIERKSGVKYLEAQVALAKQWIGNDSNGDQKEVTLNIPVETTESLVQTDKTPPKTETIPIPESEDAARQVIERFEAAAKEVRGDEDVSDNVAQHMLSDRTGLLDEKWLGTQQEELDACVPFFVFILRTMLMNELRRYVSELLYIHTKLMIVDDKRVIVGCPFLMPVCWAMLTSGWGRWARRTSTTVARRATVTRRLRSWWRTRI